MVRKLPSWRRGGALRVVTVPPRRGDEPPPPQTMSSYELKESESFESGHCTTTRGNHSFTKLKESERPGSGHCTTTLKVRLAKIEEKTRHLVDMKLESQDSTTSDRLSCLSENLKD